MAAWITILIVAVLSLRARAHTERISLDGTWTVANENSTYTADAVVPGGIYTDLRAAGILTQDIYYRFNDLEYRWVSRDNWTYSRTLEVSENVLQKQEILLVLHGVDTVASVYLNGQLVGSCDNMFVRYKFPVKPVLQAGSNQLEVKFQSPISAAEERSRIQAQDYVVPPDCVPNEYRGECHVNQLRKMQASFSWDWGPAFPSAGLWKSVELEAFDMAALQDVLVQTVESDDQWLLQVDLFLEAAPEATLVSGTFSAALLLDTHTVTETKILELKPTAPGQFNASLVLQIPKSEVELWWPNGFGSQKLYSLSVTFNSSSDKYKKTLNIGFRTVELVQEPVGTGTGLTFYFKVNNIPIFAKGSNWIPSHVLPEQSADPERIRHLFNSAKVANMNMLRVWGGGLYESDLFYQLADEMGLLIWQDFTFACAMYPTNLDYLQSVSVEITQQVRRLQHHPSLALWAGNNENEGALRGNWYGTSSNYSLYHSDYVKLYVDTIRQVTLTEDVTRQFVISSPSNGLKTEEEDYVAQDPGSSFYGDIHYYNYMTDGWNPKNYKTTRFSSEYGFQSLPSLASIIEVSEASDLSMQSQFSDHRQHHPAGNDEIRYEIQLNLQLPQDISSAEEFPIFIYFSQINQAMAIKTETEFYRRSRNLLTSDGQGLTMGALYWQLNDIWQAPSWASVEFNGRWKMLHYFAIDFFAPVLISPTVTPADVLEVHLISDLLADMQDVSLRTDVYRWDSFSPIFTNSSTHMLNKASVSKVLEQDLQQILQAAGCGGSEATKNCFLYFSLLNKDGDSISPSNFVFPQPLKDLSGLSAPSISVVSVTLVGENEFQIDLQSDRIALFVWLEAYDVSGYFSQNGFLMVSPDTSITFIARQTVTADELQKSLTISSLADFY